MIIDKIIDRQNDKEEYLENLINHQQEQLKRDHDLYDPYNSNEWDKHEWQMAYQYQIADTKWMLKTIQKDIIELKKIIRKLNQEQNKKYNNG